LTSQAVADAFKLGEPVNELTEAARGWGDHNIVYRLDTTDGQWAIKALQRELDELVAERFEIELAAFANGVAMPRPVPAGAGGPVAVVAGHPLRCHQWVDGLAKINEHTTVSENRLMGELVGHLHGLFLSWSTHFDDDTFGEDEPGWSTLAIEAGRCRSALGPLIKQNLAALQALEVRASRVRRAHRKLPRIGSHRDLNAHNVLFTGAGLRLIDWEAAGPIFAPWERACYATLWSTRDGGRYDLDALTAFLRGYRHTGGQIDREDPDTLEYLIGNVDWWARKNVHWAIEAGTSRQDDLTRNLVAALLATPATIEKRRRVLQEGIRMLERGP
jgi:Ser/Thr protein kinase RdoA (MazF antagonist)